MAGAPLPLLGTFHEISLAVPDVRTAVEFYERLGFTQATTTDAFTHPYGVLTDGRLFIGLHQRPGPSPILTFVRPGIAASLGAFAAAGIQLTSRHVGEEVFNEIAFADPSGQTVAVLEARTYSPVARAVTDASLCGDFAQVSLPAGDLTAARQFWEPLGFVAADEAQSPYPHLPLISDHLDLAFHQPGFSARPLLVFRDAGMRARIERLRELGLVVGTAPAHAAGNAVSGLLHGPDGTALLLLEEEP
jgi:catechol 2,3-dioxygenase-like lactoylglutathione lyase family enzyme